MANYDNRIPLEGLQCMEPAIVYKQVRRQNKGLRTNFIPTLIAAGYFNGITCADMARALHKSQPSTYKHLGLSIGAGYLVKRGIMYYLTDKGMKVREDTLNGMKELNKLLSLEFTKRVRRSLGRGQ